MLVLSTADHNEHLEGHRLEWHRVCNRDCGAQSHLLARKLKKDNPRVDDKQVSSAFVRSHLVSIGW